MSKDKIKKHCAHIEQMEKLSTEELEVKVKSGDFYSQYVLGTRILDIISRWKAGANSRAEGKTYDADLWVGHNGKVAWERLQKLAAEGNDYARYSMEDWMAFNEVQTGGSSRKTKPLKNYHLLDYSGQLLLSAAETFLRKEMDKNWYVKDDVHHALTVWSMERLFFHSPINKDPDFCRRWKAVAKELDLPDSP